MHECLLRPELRTLQLSSSHANRAQPQYSAGGSGSLLELLFPHSLLLTPYCHVCAMDVLQGILHSCANAVKQKRLPARPLSHTACSISACSPPAAVSACPALNVGCENLQAQCKPHGQAVASQVRWFVHLGHACTDKSLYCCSDLHETSNAWCL